MKKNQACVVILISLFFILYSCTNFVPFQDMNTLHEGYTTTPNNIVGFTIPDIADTDLEITISAHNPADDSLITATNGSYEIPSIAAGISITASVSPAETYTYTWTLFNSDGAVNPAAPVVTDNAAVYTGLLSGFYSLIVIAKDADGNAGMEFIPLYTSY